MKLKTLVGLVWLSGLLASGAAVAGAYGTAMEAKAMLEKVVAELKKDKAGALAKFNQAEGRLPGQRGRGLAGTLPWLLLPDSDPVSPRLSQLSLLNESLRHQ